MAKPHPLIFLAVLLDMASTHLGLWLGFAEKGILASRILPSIGPLYWLLEAGLLYSLYYILRKLAGLPPWWAAAAAAVGPWTAAWSNVGLVLRVVV